MELSERQKKIIMIVMILLLVGGVATGVALYFLRGTECGSSFTACELTKDFVPGVTGYSYEFSCGRTDYHQEVDRTGLWSFTINGTEFSKTSISTIIIPTWSFTIGGQTGKIGYSLSLQDKYQINFGTIEWRSLRSYLATSWPSGLKIVDNTDKILVEFNRQSLALPKVKYTVCLTDDVDNNALKKKLAIATVSAFAIGKKD